MPKYTLEELAEMTGSQLEGNPSKEIMGIADLLEAGEADAAFLANSRYQNLLEKSAAGVVCISSSACCPPHLNRLISPDPSRAFQIIAELFYAGRPPRTGFQGIHPTAVIHPTAKIDVEVEIGPYAVIDQEVHIRARTKISSHVYLGPSVDIGNDCLIYPHVTVREGCKLGNRVILQPGVVIGSCGFGYTTSAVGKHTKLEQIGNVIIEDDVEIGANTTIDRARFKSTIVKAGSKIDNLVMLGHGVEIGENVIIVSQTGIAGSTSIGDFCVLGGQVGIAGHLKIAPKTRIASKSGVSKSLESGDYNGIPVQRMSEYNRNAVLLRKMPEFLKRIEQLEKELKR